MGRSSRPVLLELMDNLLRNIKHMRSDLEPFNDRDNRLIDYANHMETIIKHAIYEIEHEQE